MKFGNPCKSGLLRYAVCWTVAVYIVAANAQQTATTSPFARGTSVTRRSEPPRRPNNPGRRTTARPSTPAPAPVAETLKTSGASANDAPADPKLLGGLLETVSDLLAVLPLWKTVGEGEPLTLSIGVNVINLVTLQWYFNGQPIPGETRGTLNLQSVTAAQVGHYQLRATLLGTTLVSIPTDVQINKTDDTVDRDVAAFDTLSDVRALLAPAAAKNTTISTPAKTAKTGTAAHGYSGTQIFNTLGATKDPGEPNHCGIPGGRSEWFAWQSPTNGTAIIHTDGSNFDTVLAIYTGPGDSYATLIPVACDNNSGANGITSRVTFDATAGTIYYIAVDGVNGASGTVRLNFIVGTPPAITAQPASRTAALGGTATLNVAAIGFPSPRYQWMFEGANIPGATNSILSLNGIAPEHFGHYTVRVTNAINALLSTTAHLLLETPLRFTTQRALSNGFHLTLSGPAGTNYAIEWTTNLLDWTPLTTNRTQTGLFEYLDTRTGNACQIYRARPVP